MLGSVSMNKDFSIRLYWYNCVDDDDPRWDYSIALYAYLAPMKAAIYYLGKCYGTTVRRRWNYDAKSDVWNHLSRFSKYHRTIIAEIETKQRLTRELLSDIESLLIYEIDPCCNVQNTRSRGKHSRPGMRIECRGKAWPLSRRVYRDE
jgi:hypothetical protein